MTASPEKRIGVVCIHVAEQGAPVLLIEHSEPVDEGDSGWGLYCGREHENTELRITDLNRLCQDGSEVASFFEQLGIGMVAWRGTAAGDWVIEQASSDESS